MKQQRKKRYIVHLSIFGLSIYVANMLLRPYQRNKGRNQNSKKKRAYRQAMLEKQQGKCAVCGKEITMEEMELHHILPKSLGGHNGHYNEIGVCHDCHRSIHSNPVFYGEVVRQHIEQRPYLLHEGQSVEDLKNLAIYSNSKPYMKEKQWKLGPIRITYGQ